jgi:hypothetical protein
MQMPKPRIAMKSLLQQKTYAQDWVEDFYTQTGVRQGDVPQDLAKYQARAAIIERLCGPGLKRILNMGCGSDNTAAYLPIWDTARSV